MPNEDKRRELPCTVGGLCDGRKWRNHEGRRRQDDAKHPVLPQDEFHNRSPLDGLDNSVSTLLCSWAVQKRPNDRNWHMAGLPAAILFCFTSSSVAARGNMATSKGSPSSIRLLRTPASPRPTVTLCRLPCSKLLTSSPRTSLTPLTLSTF